MKKICLAIASLVSVTASALDTKWDSVAVFHRPEKVLVQINEAGENSRLQVWMTALGAAEQVVLQSNDKSFSMDCMRNKTAVNCSLRLTPSANVEIGARTVSANFKLEEIGIDPKAATYEIAFLNSNGDHIEMKTQNGGFTLTAGKRQ